ncbi:PP2C family protein-serine/threonine phosphatase [Abyssisolibacter fermentans]|uniref:PP2C family protein-serine/threonine phosphatase n=1 Tax=Abyssisolibacter fermentans TaxID=1766203 RepID=UPI0008366528|nr:PP2C family protein-serine/threonine phosphatase [Abyssisolibacter fermentans]
METTFECNFAFDILDGMIDWVRVVSIEGKVIYANKTLVKDIGESIIGSKCYTLLCKDDKCKNCISKKTIETGMSHTKEEAVEDKIFSVKSSPIRDEKGNIYAAVEVFRDITKQKNLEEQITSENIKMENDIEFAMLLQQKILPHKGEFSSIKVDYIYEPSKHLSGDIFDIFEIDDRYLGVYISDVVGHGVTASMMTMFIRQTMRAIKDVHKRPADALSELHKSFVQLRLDDDKYFTIFYGIIDKVEKVFTYTNAGHNCIPVLIKDDRIILLEMQGYPITNLFDNIEYKEKNIDLAKGDSLLLYTDGIIEAKNEQDELLGFEKFIEIIKENKNDKILDIIQNKMRQLRYVNKQDDLAILKVKF